MLFIDHLQISVMAFEGKAGLSNGAVSKMTDNVRNQTLNKIVDAFPQLNPNWLRNGEGAMLKDQPTPNDCNGEDEMRVKATPTEFMLAGAEAFSQQLVKMMNDRLIAPYGQLEAKDKEIETLNRYIGRLESEIEALKKGNAPAEGTAICADAV